MDAFGYDREDYDFKNNLNLSQVTLCCSKKELDNIIEFLKYVRNDAGNTKIEYGDHWHYRDFDGHWTDESSDLIIFIDEEPE